MLNVQTSRIIPQHTFLSKRTLLLLSFFIPFTFLLLLYLILGIAPFGNSTLVLADAKGQYISYFSFYQKLMKGEADPFYSFSKILGGPVAGLFAYYLASPLNLFLLLFSPEKLPLAIDWLILIKLSLSGFTMALFFNERNEFKAESLIFSTAYALCGYNVAYAWCLIWIDAVICLPLIGAGLERLFRESNPFLYIASLSIGIISCFYTGYMLCIFSVLFFIYLFIEKQPTFNRKSIWQFMIASILAGGLSAFILLPGYRALSGGVPKGIYNSISKFTYPAITLLLQYLFPNLNSTDGLIVPFLIAVFLFFCLILCYTSYLYLLQKGSKLKRASLLCGCIMMLIVWYFFIELPVHNEVGFSDRRIFTKFIIGYTPFWEFFDGSPNVYTGSVAFMLALCYFGNQSIPLKRRIAGVLLVAVLICSLSFNLVNVIWHGFEKNNCFNYRYSFVICFVILMLANGSLLNISGISLITLFCSSCFCFLILLSNIYRPIWFFNNKLLSISVISLLYGTLAIFVCLSGKRRYFPVLAAVELCAVLLTAGMSFNNQAEGQAASAEHFYNVMTYNQKPIQYIMQNDSEFYRIRKEKPYYNYNDPLLFNYPGLSHYSSSEKINTIHFLSSLGQQTLSPYWANGDLGESRALDCLLGVRYFVGHSIEGYNTVLENIQQNPYALPLAFLADKDVLYTTDLSGNAAENLNTVFSSLCGQNIHIFSALSSKNGNLTVSNNNVLYFCVDDPLFDGYALRRNGEIIQQDSGLQGQKLIVLGSFAINDELEVLLFDNSGNALNVPREDFFYDENLDAIVTASNLLTNNSVGETVQKASQIELKLNSPVDQIILLTIPEDKGWHVSLDNQLIAPETAFNALIAIPVTAGNHHILLRYIPLGLKEGILLSLSSLFIASIWVYLKHRKRLCSSLLTTI